MVIQPEIDTLSGHSGLEVHPVHHRGTPRASDQRHDPRCSRSGDSGHGAYADRGAHEHQAADTRSRRDRFWRRGIRAGRGELQVAGGAMFTRAALVHYHEICLKGRNRASFERRLRDNLSAAVADITTEPVERISSRLLIRTSDPGRIDELVDRIAVVPGVSSVSSAYITARNADEINRAALLAVREVARGIDSCRRCPQIQYRLPGAQHGDEPCDRAVPRGLHRNGSRISTRRT